MIARQTEEDSCSTAWEAGVDGALISVRHAADAIPHSFGQRGKLVPAKRVAFSLRNLANHLQEEALVSILGAQMQIESHRLDGPRITAPTVIPEPVARQYQMLVVDSSAEGLVVAAATNPRDTHLKTWLDANLGRSYRLVLAGTQNILAAIDVVYGI